VPRERWRPSIHQGKFYKGLGPGTRADPLWAARNLLQQVERAANPAHRNGGLHVFGRCAVMEWTMGRPPDPETAAWIETNIPQRLGLLRGALGRLVKTRKQGSHVENVESQDGVVTLFGIVDSDRTKQAATAEVHKVFGVKSVNSTIQVVPRFRQDAVATSDAHVKEAIEDRLRQHQELTDDEIDIEVRNGVAHLSGKVRTQGDRLVALVVVRTTAGVHGLVDTLQVEEPSVSDG